jgi:hypothetical protein
LAKFCRKYISFECLHKQFKKSTPDQYLLYKIALLLHRVFNSTVQGKDWIDFKNQIICTGRLTTFDIHKSGNFKIGNNILSNIFTCITRLIQHDFLNLNYPSFKYKMRNIFLLNERWFCDCWSNTILYKSNYYVLLHCF